MQMKVVVEVDGASHRGIRGGRLDPIRDEWLERAGYVVLRVTAFSVLTDLTGVLGRIAQALANVS